MACFLFGVVIARYFLVAPGNPPQKHWIAERLGFSIDCVGPIGVNLSGHRRGCIFYFVTLVKWHCFGHCHYLLARFTHYRWCVSSILGGKGGGWKFWSTMALLPLFPLTTLIFSGFLGYGIRWSIAVATFLFAQSKRPIGYILSCSYCFLHRTFRLCNLHGRARRNPADHLV